MSATKIHAYVILSNSSLTSVQLKFFALKYRSVAPTVRPKKALKYLLLNSDPSELVTHFLFRVVLLYCRGSPAFQAFASALFPDGSRAHLF